MNPEYWSSDYVLVCNLKTYFVNKAIELNLVNN
ncbi:WlaTC/HtrL family glycosyltransferase, partial [Citrobacter werkmanii]